MLETETTCGENIILTNNTIINTIAETISTTTRNSITTTERTWSCSGSSSCCPSWPRPGSWGLTAGWRAPCGGRRWWRLGTVTLSRSRPQSHTHCRAAESEARWWSNGESMWVFRWFYYPLAFNQLNVQFGGDALMFDIFISISHFKRKLDYKQNIEVKSRNSNSSQCENFQCKLYQIRFY